MKELKLAKAKQEDATDPKSNNKRSRDLRNKCYNTNQPAPPSCWDIGELIGYNGMLDVKEVWDALAHNPDKMIEEVEMKLAILNLSKLFHCFVTCSALSAVPISCATKWVIGGPFTLTRASATRLSCVSLILFMYSM